MQLTCLPAGMFPARISPLPGSGLDTGKPISSSSLIHVEIADESWSNRLFTQFNDVRDDVHEGLPQYFRKLTYRSNRFQNQSRLFLCFHHFNHKAHFIHVSFFEAHCLMLILSLPHPHDHQYDSRIKGLKWHKNKSRRQFSRIVAGTCFKSIKR